MRHPLPRLASLLALGALLAGCAAGAATPGPARPSGSSPDASAPSPRPAPSDTTGPSVPLRAGERYVSLGIADGLPGGVYHPSAPDGGTDDYRCLLLDPRITSPSYVTGVQFLPDQAAVVHHAILFRVDPGQVAAAREQDAADPAPGWQCFGGTGIPDGRGPLQALDAAPWVAGWAPGGREQVFPTGFGVPLAPGSLLVAQIHYNLRAAHGDVSDDTRVRLRVTSGRPLQPLQTMLLPAPVELPCPAGVSGPLCDRDAAIADVVQRFGQQAFRTIGGLQLLCGGDPVHPVAGATQSCTRYLDHAVTVRAVAGHMHLLGARISIVANAGTPRARTLLRVPVWDFDDQRAVPLAHPAALRTGDTVTVTCTHDPTLRTKLPELAGTPPRYVVWGEGTTDEMCLGILVVTRD